jgi:hypothetical protein
LVLFLLCLLFSVFSAGLAEAADLHFIALAETLDPGIGSDVDLDKAHMWAEMISSHTGLTLQYHQLSGEDLTAWRVHDLLRSISPGDDDVVYFVYSGHGANLGKSQWPSFLFMTGDTFDFTEVLGILQPKSQRLLIALADCCNVSIDSGRATPLPDPSAQSARTIANFQNLFLNFRGTITASSSSQGQYSLGQFGEGGLFINTFLDDFLQMAASVPDLTWRGILFAAAADTFDLAAQYGEIQKPQVVVNTEEVAADTPTPPSSDGPAPGDDDVSASGGNASGSASAPACGPMMTLPLAAAFCVWVIRRRAGR